MQIDEIPQGSAKFVIPDWCGPADMKFGFRVLRRGSPETFDVVEFFENRTSGFLVFGRDPGCSDIFVGHRSISRQQAAVVWHRNNYCYLIDLESESGTKLNGQVLGPNVPFMIYPNDRISFGKAARTYVFSPDIKLAVEDRNVYRKEIRHFEPDQSFDLEDLIDREKLRIKPVESPPRPFFVTAKDALAIQDEEAEVAAGQYEVHEEQRPPPPPSPGLTRTESLAKRPRQS